MAASGATFIGDADLHGLVDGHIEAGRRADALRRLAASPTDRARVEAWQGQNDLLRSAFAGVDREPLPAVLDLKAKPRLHCVPPTEAPILAPPVATVRSSGRGRVGLAMATLMVIAAGLGGAWYMLGGTWSASDTMADPEETVASAPLRGSVDATLATRSAEALAGISRAPRTKGAIEPLPTTGIPDLTQQGFSLASAASDTSGPSSIQFRYRNAGSDTLVVTVARAAAGDAPSRTLQRIGAAYSWHKRDNAYAIAGTVRPSRLRAIAVSLLDDDPAR